MRPTAEPGAVAVASARMTSLDQFRGYTVLGMLLVNFLGRFECVPPILKHHNTYCSYADTIMPQFFFAVGAAYRLTFLRRRDRAGEHAAYGRAIVRAFGLIVLGVVLYGLDGGVRSWDELRGLGLWGFLRTAFVREPFQALVHIGLTVLWITPVIGAGWRARVLYAAASALVFVVLSQLFYFDHAWSTPVIDGGPLGFLTWTIPLIAGSVAYDLWKAVGPACSLAPLAAGAFLLMAGGQVLTALGPAGMAPWPFIPPDVGRGVDMWTMSQRTGSVTYLLFSAGFSLLVFAGFVWACDVGKARMGLFQTFGMNALAAYVLHGMVDDALRPYVPKDAPGWFVVGAVLLFVLVCWGMVRALERQGLFIRI